MRLPQVRFLLFIVSVLSFILFSTCDDKRVEYIPYVYVNFTVDLNINNSLAIPGYSEIYPFEGFGGVVVYCEFYDVTTPDNSIFHAFDAACTVEVIDTCRIVNEGNSFYGECPCCNTKYEFLTGNAVEGSAPYPLKYYKVSVLNNRLYIRN